MKISELDIKELKALAYDQMVELQIIQNNLRLINEEIAKKQEQMRQTATSQKENSSPE